MRTAGNQSLPLGQMEPALSGSQRRLKRAFDFVFSLATIILLSPIFAAIAALILLADGLPVLFFQQRVGENGRLFRIVKFRTMVRDASERRYLVEKRDESGRLLHKSKHDPRVTRIGRVLRRYSLDELPQLVNVLRGDMSLVGPRPELPRVVDEYQAWQWQRLSVPPGMTGWWQVTGRSEKLLHLHTEDDIYYVQHYSFGLDMKILLLTLWAVIRGRGAY